MPHSRSWEPLRALQAQQGVVCRHAGQALTIKTASVLLPVLPLDTMPSLQDMRSL